MVNRLAMIRPNSGFGGLDYRQLQQDTATCSFALGTHFLSDGMHARRTSKAAAQVQ